MPIDYGRRRIRAERSPNQPAPVGGLVEAQVATTIIRRLGFVACKVHESVMRSLLNKNEQETAERFNDCFKPIVDMLLNFDIVSRETEDTWPGDAGDDSESR